MRFAGVFFGLSRCAHVHIASEQDGVLKPMQIWHQLEILIMSWQKFICRIPCTHFLLRSASQRLCPEVSVQPILGQSQTLISLGGCASSFSIANLSLNTFMLTTIRFHPLVCYFQSCNIVHQK